MSTTRKIAHNTLIQVGGKIISTLLGLVALGMMTRYLGTEQFGWYTTVISFLGFVGILIDFGLIPVTAQMMSEPLHDKTKLFKNLLGFRFVTAVVFLGLAPLVALFFPYPGPVKIAIAFSTLSFLGVAMNQVLVGLYQTKLKMYIPTLGEVLGRIALITGLWFVISRGASFLPVMIVLVIAALVQTATLWIAAQKETVIGFAFDWSIWKAIITKMWPIAISIIFNVVYLRGDTLLLSIMRSQSEVGIYGAAYRVLDIVAQLAMMIMGVMLPLMAYAWSRQDTDGFKKFYQQSFDIMMMLGLPMMTGLIFLAGPIISFVAGTDFAPAGAILQILAIAVFGVYLGAVFGHAAVAINKQKQTMWIYISDAILTLAGYLIFIPKFGLAGAAWMTVFSELYAGVLLFWTIRYHSQQSLRINTLGKIIAASAVMGGTLNVLQEQNIFLLILIGIVVYSVVLFGLGGVSKETVREILGSRD